VLYLPKYLHLFHFEIYRIVLVSVPAFLHTAKYIMYTHQLITCCHVAELLCVDGVWRYMRTRICVQVRVILAVLCCQYVRERIFSQIEKSSSFQNIVLKRRYYKGS